MSDETAWSAAEIYEASEVTEVTTSNGEAALESAKMGARIEIERLRALSISPTSTCVTTRVIMSMGGMGGRRSEKDRGTVRSPCSL